MIADPDKKILVAHPGIQYFLFILVFFGVLILVPSRAAAQSKNNGRQQILINEGWKFFRYTGDPDKLIYDIRPEVTDRNDNVVADSRPTESVAVASSQDALKRWILPSASAVIKDLANRHQRPEGNPGKDFPFVQSNFDDRLWKSVNLPHDRAIEGPFYKEADAIVGGGMGRLPVQGHPLLWGPPPTQQPNLYIAITRVLLKGKLMDEYQTRFGIRSLKFDPVNGVEVNRQAVRIQGVNQHHDLGALGAAFNIRAAERQLGILRELGCNAIRLAHNPPAPELLDLTDCMGFLVIDEIFDSWKRKKTPLDFHLIFPDWYEADTRDAA